MQREDESVGKLLRHYQTAKNLTTEALAAELGMSTSTYRRILSDDTVIKAPAFFSLLDALRLDPSEVAAALPSDWFPLQTAYTTLTDAIGPATRAFLLDDRVESGPTQASLAKLQAAYAKTGNQGYQQYAWLAEIFLAELAQDGAAARRLAETLYQSLIAQDNWGSSELQLVASIATYLAFDRLKVIFNRHLYHGARGGQADALAEQQVNLLFRSFLDNAIQARDAADIRTAMTWIRERPIADTALGYRTLLRLCDIVTSYLQGDVPAATTCYKRLVAALRLLTHADDNIWLLVVEDLWLNLGSFHIDELADQGGDK